MENKTGYLSLPRELRIAIAGSGLRCAGRVRLVAIRRTPNDGGRTWDIHYGPEELDPTDSRLVEQRTALKNLAVLRTVSHQIKKEAEEDFFGANKFDLMVKERSIFHPDPAKALPPALIGMIEHLDIFAVTLFQRVAFVQCSQWNGLVLDDRRLRMGRLIGVDPLGNTFVLSTRPSDDICIKIATRYGAVGGDAYTHGPRPAWNDDILQHLLNELRFHGSITLPFAPIEYGAESGKQKTAFLKRRGFLAVMLAGGLLSCVVWALLA